MLQASPFVFIAVIPKFEIRFCQIELPCEFNSYKVQENVDKSIQDQLSDQLAIIEIL
ncbi:MAG: hypothetical protein LBQ59_01505 [Candidatus Peribacteria bacterium]|jgi:hypothetical protein|nr:hypothetical protein [Candidatus Peribacteria bacterium]